MARMFKVVVNGIEQDGEFTAEQCGVKTEILLTIMGSVTIEYKAIKD